MPAVSLEIALNDWLRSHPVLSGFPKTDVEMLSYHVQAGQDILGCLAPKRRRSSEESLYASRIQGASRKLRQQFMDLHAEWLYGVMTNDRSTSRSLGELCFIAAERCPGLLPTSADMAEERSRLQADKEGREIDQGIFFHSLLRLPDTGIHMIESALKPSARAKDLLPRFCREGRLDLGSVLLEVRDRAAHLTVNNSHCLNAEDDRLIDDMETAVDLTLLNDDIQVGVLRGGIMSHPRYMGRRVFSAGINLKALHAGQISFVDFLLRRELGYINKITRGLILEESNEGQGWRVCRKVIEKPWIAAVDSFAIGGGAQLLLVFDRVIGASDSYFSLPAAQEGIVPGFANQRLGRLLGSRKARQVVLHGRKIWAHEQDAELLFDEVVDTSELDAAVERSVRQLSNPAVIANRHMLNLAEEPVELFRQYAAEFALVQAERLYSQDVLEKVRGFSVEHGTAAPGSIH